MRRSTSIFFSLVSSALALTLAAGPALAGLNFSPAEPVAIPPKPDFFAIGDLNNDGRDDVCVVSGASDQVSVLLGQPTNPTRFTPLTTMSFGKKLRKPALGDLNNDGNLDLVVPDQGGSRGVWMLLGRGDGTFAPPQMINVGKNPYAVAIANFDGRLNNDLAISDQRQDVVLVRLNDGGNPPRFNTGPQLNTGGGGGPEDVFSVDLNADGNADVSVLNQGGPRVKDMAVFYFQRVLQGIPVFDPAMNFIVGERPESIHAADLNGDGTPDFVMLNRIRTTGNSNVESVIADPSAPFLLPPITTEIGCPFFTGGLFCRSRALAPADYDGNGTIDLAITLTDPRQSFTNTDAMQAFSGRGDGAFIAGAVFTVFKRPQVAGAGDFTGDGAPEVAVGATRRLSVQAFVNISTPGEKGNGEDCLFGDECVSNRCIDGVCCASQCEEGQFCNIPGFEGTCTEVPEMIPCEEDFDCETGFCRDGFCCNDECPPPGRCNNPGFEGLCIDLLPDGEECVDDAECFSTFCRNGVCCKEPCDNGICNEFGVCEARRPNGDPCVDDDDCDSGVCDDFDGICCNRRCDPVDEFCDANSGGTCQPINDMLPNGDRCTFPTQCRSGFCTDGVCCEVEECPEGLVCGLGTGVCGAGRDDGDRCTDADQCASGFCVNGVCCSVAGCPAGEFCQLITGTCAPDLPDGDRCEEDADCSSGFCVNGVCCVDPECPGDFFCQLNTGVCGPDMPDGNDCTDGSECHSMFCVDGVCCSASACPPGEFCQPNTGICGPGVPNGDRCEDTTDCATGFCVNGVCCGVPDCPAGEFCQLDSGVCGPGRPDGDTCNDGRDCSSGFCVNGICCVIAACPEGEVCLILSGQCGPVPTPTPQRSPTRIPSSTVPAGGQPTIITSSSGGCQADGGGTGGSGLDLLLVALLPIAFWGARRVAARRQVRVRND